MWLQGGLDLSHPRKGGSPFCPLRFTQHSWAQRGGGQQHFSPDDHFGGRWELAEVGVDQRGCSQEVPLQRAGRGGQVGCRRGGSGLLKETQVPVTSPTDLEACGTETG